MLSGMLISRFGSQRMVFFVARVKQEDLVTLGALLESRKVTPVIDSRHRLSDASQAMRRLSEGHARGKVVVTLEHLG
jgi:NADPH:quinone reductase-like Zn-dependent oxidoreductase